MKKILLAIPAHNESLTIQAVIEESRSVLQRLFSNSYIDVLVINDNSTDNTVTLAEASGAHVITYHQRQGLGAVFSHAVTYAVTHGYDLMITIDGDKQFSADDIPALCAPVISGKAHMVTGSRFLHDSKLHNMPSVKKIGNHIVARVISWIVEEKWHDVSCGFRVYSRDALLHLRPFGKFTYTHDVILHLSKKELSLTEVPITTHYFKERKSRIAHNLFRYGYQSLKIIVRSVIYYRPLRFFGFLTTLFWTISIPIALILGIRYAITDTITPFKGIGVVSLSFLGAGFLSIIAGVTLDILSRIYHTTEEVLYFTKKKHYEDRKY